MVILSAGSSLQLGCPSGSSTALGCPSAWMSTSLGHVRWPRVSYTSLDWSLSGREGSPPRLNYCNVFYMGLLLKTVQKLQVVKNAPVQMLTGARQTDHFTSIVWKLLWLPVLFCAQFKVLVVTYNVLGPNFIGLGPGYLKEHFSPLYFCKALKIICGEISQDCSIGPRSTPHWLSCSINKIIVMLDGSVNLLLLVLFLSCDQTLLNFTVCIDN